MDPDCEPLRDYLEPAATMLDPFRLQDMRCKWRKWLHFECNWKVAMEAFNETYHVATTHPQFNKFGNFRGWADAQGKHSNIGYDAPEGSGGDQVEDPARHRRRPPRLDRRDAALHLGGNQRHHHQNTGGRRAAAGRRAARGRARQQGARALADVGAARRCRARRDLADDRSRTSGQERHRVADLPELPDRAGPDHRAVLQRPAPRLRPRQVHLRGVLLRAVSRKAKSRKPNGCTRRRTTRTGAACCRRTSPTWPPFSKA